MRVAYVSCDPGVPIFGMKGCSVHVQEVVRAMMRAGAHVELFTPRPGGEAPADLRSAIVHVLPLAGKASPEKRERSVIEANVHLASALEAGDGFDLVYERYSLWGRAAIEYAARKCIPSILEVNAPLIEEQQAFRALVHYDTAVENAHFVFSHATALVAVSPAVAAYVRRHGTPEHRLHVVPNGVDASRFGPHVSPEAPSNTFTVGFVGTLKPWHGVDVFLDAAHIIQTRGIRHRVVIVGDGPERASLEKKAEASGLRNVVFAGAVPPDSVPGWLRSFDAAVAPYPRTNGFYFSPMKLFEYMAAGVPVVASRLGQIEDVLDGGNAGLLVEPGDPADLANALLELAKRPALRKSLVRTARRRVLDLYTWDHVVGQIFSVVRAATSLTSSHT